MASRFYAKLSLVLLLCIFPGGPIFADADEVRAYLANSNSTTYLEKDGRGLEILRDGRNLAPNRIAYQKTIDGIPLLGGKVIVTRDGQNRILDVYDDSTEDLKAEFGLARVTSAQAQVLANARLGKATALSTSNRLVWFRDGNMASLAWEVTTQLSETNEPVSPSELVTVVDAATGQIVSQSQRDDTEYYRNDLKTIHGIFPRIVINDAIGGSGSRAYASDFDAVIAFDFGCTGVLITPNVVLSARHCEVLVGDQVLFGTDSNNPTFSTTVQSTILPDGNGSLLDGGDVVIVRLNNSVPANVATPMRLIDATNDLEGMVAATVGYGYNGVGSQGHGFTADGRRWGGENIIDRYGSPADASGSNIISTDFDNGSSGANTIPGSSPTPLQFEATTAPGDSGGPVMVQLNGEWVIAGVLSGGTTNTSVYGDISWWTGTAIYRSQLEAQGGQFVDDSGVLLGDVNRDGNVNLLDVEPFIAVLSDGGFQLEADINEDGEVNLLDIQGFIDLVGGG